MSLKNSFQFSADSLIKTCAVDSAIYLIENGIVGKAKRNEISSSRYGVEDLRRGAYPLEILNNGNNICSKLFERGYSVPRPLGVFEVFCEDNGNFYPMFLTEYWENGNGKSIENLKRFDYSLYEWAKELRNDELRRMREDGFVPFDELHEGNTLYSIEKDKICILDFDDWGFGRKLFIHSLRGKEKTNFL